MRSARIVKRNDAMLDKACETNWAVRGRIFLFSSRFGTEFGTRYPGSMTSGQDRHELCLSTFVFSPEVHCTFPPREKEALDYMSGRTGGTRLDTSRR